MPVTGAAIIAMGHDCRLIPPIYVKPFAGRLQADRNDAAAIAGTAQRRAMRFVAVKSEEAQADAMLPRPGPPGAAANADRGSPGPPGRVRSRLPAGRGRCP